MVEMASLISKIVLFVFLVSVVATETPSQLTIEKPLGINSTNAEHYGLLSFPLNALQNILQSVFRFQQTVAFNTVPRFLSSVFFVVRTLTSLLRAVPFTKFLFDVRDGIASASACMSCNVLATLLTTKVIPNNVLIQATRLVCVGFRLQTYDVCHGIINSFKDTFAYVRQNTKLTPSEMCAVFISSRCSNKVTENINWQLQVPPRWNKKASDVLSGEAQRTENFQVAQVTDVHLDLFYAQKSRVDCEEPVCCRDTRRSLFQMTFASEWGHERCDTPLRVVQSFVSQIASNSNVSYLMLSGDFPPHDIWQYTKENNLFLIESVYQILKHNISVPIYPAIGNHEAVPVNCFPPLDVESKFSNAWLYQKVAQLWKNDLPPEAIQTLAKFGSYVIRLKPGLRLVALNTNYCARLNPWILYKPQDIGGQLEWLIQELVEAENAGEKVHIVGHMPPDHRECTQAWLENFIRISERFQETIIAQFYGHTHRDEFRVMYSLLDTKHPVGFELIAPSLTSYSGTNPSYRVYTIDGTNHQVLNYDVQYLDLNESKSPKWKKEYSTNQMFGKEPFTAKFLHYILDKLKTNSTFLDIYQRNYYAGSFPTEQLETRLRLLQMHEILNPRLVEPIDIIPI